MIGVLSFHLRIPGCNSLKEKRGQLKPLLHRLHREFNVSVAEMDLQDMWREAVVCCGMIGNDSAHLQSALEKVRRWVEANWSEGDVRDTNIEIL